MKLWRILWRIVAALLLLAVIAAMIAWVLRKDIARNYVDREIKRRGVPASYQITAIGPSRQRLENIRFGDAAHPDLTADWAEILTRTGFSGVTIREVRAGGVRLRGRLIDGQLSFGVVDKLLPAPTAKAFTLPDIDVEISDARIGLATPYGAIGGRFDGRGNIANSLNGKLAVTVPAARVGEKCGASNVTAYVDLTTHDRRIGAKGPLRARMIDCAGGRIESGTMLIDVIAGETLDRIDGDVAVETGRARYAGATMASARAAGRVKWANASYKVEGTASATGFMPPSALRARGLAMIARARATPLGPISAILSDAISAFSRGSSLSSRYSVAGDKRGGRIVLDAIRGRSVSGASFALTDGSTARLNWPDPRLAVEGGMTLVGGGFPQTRIIFDRQSGGRAGITSIAPLVAGGTRLALSPIRFDYGARGLALDGTALFDGAIGGGSVSGLRIPLKVSGGGLANDCLAVGFDQYRIATLALSPARLSLCLRAGQAFVTAPRLSGRLGQTPLLLSAQSARFATATGAFNMAGVGVRLGDAQRLSQLDLAVLEGRVSAGAAAGRFSGTSGQIGNVPLLLSEAAGTWQFSQQVLTLGGSVKVADSDPARRFLPFVSEDFSLRLADNQIIATGHLREPVSRAIISAVDIRHNLSRGTGKALLTVENLQFGNALQPEALTPITLGVIANVNGAVSGSGAIRWNNDGVTSDGRFRTDNLDFAAAFGPVTGLKGEIALSDLLGLVTPPGQSVAIASINPGIAVTDGEVRYRLLPGLKAEIEGGRWPFAGGTLILEPTVLNLTKNLDRRLTFRVEGLDAALFMQQLAFENISVTGKFDGVLPMVFDETGGRIENGKLTVREDGGTLAYVGEISNANLGRYSRLAFDALKSMRYKRLTLELNGALDGEMVTVVRFNGVNQLPLAQTKNFFLKQFNSIPFLFNITIKAPFRGLFTMFRSFNDPSQFIPTVLPPQLAPVKAEIIPEKPVQTKESEPVR